MYICYIDESGDSGTFQLSDPNSNPLFVIIGLIVAHHNLLSITHRFLEIKRRFFPDLFRPKTLFLDSIQQEIKGNDLRKALRGGNRRRFQQSIGYIDACMKLLTECDVKLLGTDGRRKPQDSRTTHTIFTQLHQSRGSGYSKIIEMPSYGHSNNFAMLQLADIICSAVIFPMLINVFGDHLSGSNNTHLSDKYIFVRERYKTIIKNMQYRYLDTEGFTLGGLLVSDSTGLNRKTSLLFR